jgi:quercetin dioxygenase-like cupin family protein
VASKETVSQETRIVGNPSDAYFEINSSDAPSVYFTTVEGEEVGEPVLSKIIWPGPRGTILEHWLTKGQVIPFHRHNTEFLNFLVRGKVNVTVGGKRYTADDLSSWTAVAGVEHSVEAVEDSLIVEFFTPAAIIVNETLLTWGSAEPADLHYFARESELTSLPMPLVEGTDEKVGVSSIAPKLFVPGPNVCMNLARCKPGKQAHHIHWHNWFTYMVTGGFTCWMGGRQFEAPIGHYWGAAPGVDHANFSPGDSAVLELKWPVPQFFLGRLKSWEAPVEQ